MRKDAPDVLGMLIRHELAIKALYEIFATIFVDHQIFWQNLASDEQRHADWLATLRSDSIAANRLVHGSRLKPQAIKTSTGYVETRIARAKEGNISILQALSIARDLESALLERHCSKPDASAPKEIRWVLSNLADETEEHLRTVVDMMVSEKRQN